MRFLPTLALGLFCSTLALGGLAGCEKDRAEMRPDMDKISGKERGLQSRDLREMTDKMAPDLLQIPEIVANPAKIVIVMKPISNKTSSLRGQDLTIYVARLKGLLNSKARDRLAFVEERETLQRLQNQELDGRGDAFEDASRRGAQPTQRLQPQYVLWGEFMDIANANSSYYLCTFKLTNIRTGEEVWTGMYETKTLNP